jgi:hypothetical protein
MHGSADSGMAQAKPQSPEARHIHWARNMGPTPPYAGTLPRQALSGRIRNGMLSPTHLKKGATAVCPGGFTCSSKRSENAGAACDPPLAGPKAHDIAAEKRVYSAAEPGAKGIPVLDACSQRAGSSLGGNPQEHDDSKPHTAEGERRIQLCAYSVAHWCGAARGTCSLFRRLCLCALLGRTNLKMRSIHGQKNSPSG